jgi:hypothetical protein
MLLDPIADVDRPQFVALEHVITPENLYLAKDPGRPDPRVLIDIDGKVITPAVTITASRTGAPQAVLVRWPLASGMHIVHVQPTATAGGGAVYIICSTWKGASNSRDSFGIVQRAGYTFRIKIPAPGP